MKRLILATVAASALMFGCATITRGTHEQVSVGSTPSGASVSSDRGHGCQTPCTLKLSRSGTHVITASKPGYEPQTQILSPEISGGGVAVGLVGNVLLGGVAGVVIDSATGAMNNLTSNNMHFQLQRKINTYPEIPAVSYQPAPQPVPARAPLFPGPDSNELPQSQPGVYVIR